MSTVIVDPFFDQTGPGVMDCNTPDEAAYHDPAALDFGGGSGIAGGERAGLRGTVIPRAVQTPAGGMSQGHNPHQPQKRVLIDPDIPGQSCEVDMSQITQAAVSQASQGVQHTGRTGASEVYHNLANQQKSAAAPPVATAPEPSPQQPAFTPPVGAPAANATAEFGGGMLNAFGQPASVSPAAPGGVPQQPAQSLTSQPPSIRVTFEIQGIGQMEGWYHQVVIDGATLVLVYDTVFPGPKFFPAQAEQPFAAYVERDRTLYLVLATGIQYAVGSQQHCCLLIQEARQLNDQQQAELGQKLHPGT